MHRFLAPIMQYQAAVIAALVVTGLSATVLAPSFAQTATDSADTVNIDLIKERLQKTAVMGATDGTQKHALVGQVQRVTGEAITIETTQGTTSILPLADVVLLNQKEEPITIDSVVIDSWVTALGYLSNETTFTPAYILVAAESLQPRPQYISIGSITEITLNKLLVAPRNNPSEVAEVSLLKTTIFQDPTGETVEPDAFEEDMQVLVVGYAEDDGFEASTVRSLAPLSNE